MYTSLKANGAGDFANGLYWSSTAADLENAYAVDFSTGNAEPTEKHHQYHRVRPVRAF
jgi:hypothetical protein